MGLPLFTTPVEAEVASKAAEKIASQPRSSIRRHRTLRVHHGRQTVVEARRRRIMGLMPEGYFSYQAEVMEGQRGDRPNVVEVPSLTALQSRSLRLERLERMRMRDTLSYERQHLSNSEIDRPLMPPVPESRDYSEAEERQRHIEAQTFRLQREQQERESRIHSLADEDVQRRSGEQTTQLQRDSREREREMEPRDRSSRSIAAIIEEQRQIGDTLNREAQNLRLITQDFRRLRRRHPAPTPPYAENDLAYVDSTTRTDSPRLSSTMTPVLSPVRQASTGSDSPPRRHFEEADFSLTARGLPRSEGLSTSTVFGSRNAIDINSLRSRQARLDGLGDRDRSLSPDGGVAAWDTLLTSITPDPQEPSAGSSFASASAAAATASSPSGSGPSSGSVSARTSMTSLDRPTEHECDVSDSGTNTEDEEEGLYDIQEFAGTRGRGERFWRTYADVVTAREGRATAEAGLGEMRRIMSRLVRTDELQRLQENEAELNRVLNEPSPSR